MTLRCERPTVEEPATARDRPATWVGQLLKDPASAVERSNSTGYPKLRLVYQLGSDFQGWIAGSVKLLSFAMPCPVKVFAGNDLPAADAWIVR